MSACWLDFDNDGKQDIYAAGMWVAAGMRVFGQSHFHGESRKRFAPFTAATWRAIRYIAIRATAHFKTWR